jgi:hypothetical protein
LLLFPNLSEMSQAANNTTKVPITTEHPITPPPELVQQWMRVNNIDIAPLHLAQALATQAARWGADQELEACCEWLDKEIGAIDPVDLRAARRPKPPSLKELAMQAWCRFQASDHTTADEMMSDFATIRRALEQLPDHPTSN